MSARGDAISDNNANDPGSRPAAPAGLRWGDADLPAPPPADRTSVSGEREVKGVFGVPKPPPPAGASLAGTPNADPLASLFATDTIVKAPGIHDAPSEAELGRWRATMQSSLFEERVVDPAPPRISLPAAAAPRARIELDSDIPAAPMRVAPPVEVSLPPAPPPARAPVRESPPRVLQEALPRPASRVEAEPDEPPPRPEKARSTKSTGKRRRAAAEAAAVAAAAAAAAEAEAARAAPVARRRRVERGPSKAMLAALGIGVVSAIAALIIVLGPSGGESVEQSAIAAPPPPAPNPAPAAATAAPAPVAAEPPAAPAPKANKASPAAAAASARAGAAPKAAGAAPAADPTKAGAPAATAATSDDDSEEGAPESLLRAGRQALSADDAPTAERIARQALAQYPQDHHAMELMVLALMDQDRGTEALPYARRMVAKRSRRVPYRLLLGDLLLMVGDDGAARAEWQKALALSPGDRAIKRRLGL